MRRNFVLVIAFIFLLLTAIFFVLKTSAPAYRFNVLMTGNAVMAVLSLLTFFIVQKTMNDKPEAFVRGVYGATFLKLLICIGSILFYALLNRQHIHKPSLFVLFGIYAVYTAAESWMLSKLARQAK